MFIHFFLPVRMDFIFQILLWYSDARLHDLNHVQTKHYFSGVRGLKRSTVDESSILSDGNRYFGKFSTIFILYSCREW